MSFCGSGNYINFSILFLYYPALIGAFSNAFKGFNLSEILFGKRELSTLDDLVWKLVNLVTII